MSWAIPLGTTIADWIDTKPTPAGCVRFDGALPEFRVWDPTLGEEGNIRAMTQEEIAALPAQRRAEREAALPQYAALVQDAQGALTANDTYLTIATSATNAQVRTQVERLTRQNNRMIPVLLKVVQDALEG